MAGRERATAQMPNAPQALDVVVHVAIGRVDHDRRAVDDLVAGEQPVAFRVQIAEMIRRVPGRMDRLENELGGFETVAIIQHSRGYERFVLLRAGRRRPPEQLGAGGVGKQAGAGRVIRMRVRDQHPADRPPGQRNDVVNVAGQRRPRIEHRDFPVPEHVGIRSGPRHHRRVGSDDPADSGLELGERFHARAEIGHHTAPG